MSPASAWLIGGPLAERPHEALRALEQPLELRARQASSVSRWRSDPSGAQLLGHRVMAVVNLAFPGEPAPEDHRGGGAVDVASADAPAALRRSRAAP